MKKVYLHKGQMDYHLCMARSSVLFASRRWGKSYPVADTIMTCVLEMPGRTGVYYAKSFRQAHSRTLPSALMALVCLVDGFLMFCASSTTHKKIFKSFKISKS